MENIRIIQEAIKELKLQKRLIKRQYGRYDSTLYRAWVENLIPYMLPILKKAETALRYGAKDLDFIEEIRFAAKIIGEDMKEEKRKAQTIKTISPR